MNFWPYILLTVIAMARIGMGIYNALSGPTLLYLSANVDVGVGVISTLFIGRSIGNSIGAMMGGASKRYLKPTFHHSILLGIGIGVLGVMELVVPWTRDFWLLMMNILIGGIMYGYLDAGLQALILRLWGEKASRPHIQIFHCMYSVGAFMAPFLANPFLEMASQKMGKGRCPDDRNQPYNQSNSSTKADDLQTLTDYFNPVSWSYIIVALWIGFVSLLFIVLSLNKIETKVSASLVNEGFSSEERCEESVKDLVWVFIGIIAFYFFAVTVANVPYYFTYSIAICSGLEFTVTNATRLNAVFWFGYGTGRVTGAFASKRFKPGTIITFCIVGSLFDMTVMAIWGEYNPWVAWAMIGIHGFTTSMLYPSGVSWLSEITNVSGTYMFIFSLGSTLGSLSMSPLAGYIFEIDPFSVIYLVLGLACGNAIVFGVAYLIGRRHLEKTAARLSQQEDFKIISRNLLKKGEGNRDCSNKNAF